MYWGGRECKQFAKVTRKKPFLYSLEHLWHYGIKGRWVGITFLPHILLLHTDQPDTNMAPMMSLQGGFDWLLKGGVMCACDKRTLIELRNAQMRECCLHHTPLPCGIIWGGIVGNYIIHRFNLTNWSVGKPLGIIWFARFCLKPCKIIGLCGGGGGVSGLLQGLEHLDLEI